MAKNNEKIWKISRILVPIFIALLVAVYAYGRLNGRVEAVEIEVKKVDTNEKAIIGLQKDIEYIKKGVDDIKGQLQDARTRRGTRTTE